MLGLYRWIAVALVVLCHVWHGAGLCADDKTPDTAKLKDAAKPKGTAELKTASPQEIRAWIEQLDSASFRQRESATRALQSAGSNVIGPIGQAVDQRGPEVAWRALVVLKEICISGDAASSDEAAAVLQKLAESKNRSIVADAKRALVSWRQVRQERAIARISQLGGHVSISGTTIYQLVLDENWQGDTDDLRLLTHLISLSNLDLHGEKFTDEAVPHLARIAGLGQLNLYMTAISPKGGNTIKAKAPNASIQWLNNAVLGVRGDITGGGGGKGCRITRVYPGTGAHKAGLQAGDVITKLDDAPVTSFSELTRRMVTKKVGQKVKVYILRGEEKLSLEVTLGKRSQIQPRQVLPAPFPAP